MTRRSLREALASKWLVPVLGGLTTFALTLNETVIGPVVALANNGDFDRLLHAVGLRVVNSQTFTRPYAQLDYVTGHTASQGAYPTSYEPFLYALTHVATAISGGHFDVRLLGVIFSLATAVAVFWFTSCVDGRVSQLVCTVLLVLLLTDVNMVAYFNSFYDEPFALVVLLAVVCLLSSSTRQAITRRRLLTAALAALIFASSMAQNMPAAIPIVLWIMFCRVSTPGLQHRWYDGRRLPILLGLIVLSGSVLVVFLQAPVYREENQYDEIFQEILGHSQSVPSDLQQLGLPASDKHLAGTNAYQPGNVLKSVSFQNFDHDGGEVKIVYFYLSHPYRTVEGLFRGERQGLRPHLWYLGYGVQGQSSKAYSGGCGLCVYSRASTEVSGWGPLLVPALYALGVGAVVSYRRHGHHRLAETMLVLIGVSLVALFVGVVGEGEYEESKHLFIFYACNGLLLAMAAAAYTCVIPDRWVRRWRRGQSEIKRKSGRTLELETVADTTMTNESALGA